MVFAPLGAGCCAGGRSHRTSPLVVVGVVGFVSVCMFVHSLMNLASSCVTIA